ncbi:MAG: hypothetical protein AVDCRST_MAG66-2497 [uncultured Pseudonocardia sp.]|uniref:Uncharacterized protein n=1 Tax=uncultured Pseudonocardia sp. TaxID=211455 RepID=A0A6J4PKG8_9PSEU|nr:MAG: hypothetical protein AVDCRST_MAG66-2497 [uncultured Pseudonocardia sp.]
MGGAAASPAPAGVPEGPTVDGSQVQVDADRPSPPLGFRAQPGAGVPLPSGRVGA